MNIFVLDEDPAAAAIMLCDKHIPKMIVESAQMLSTAHRMLDGTLTKKRSRSGKTMVKYYKYDDIRYVGELRCWIRNEKIGDGRVERVARGGGMNAIKSIKKCEKKIV